MNPVRPGGSSCLTRSPSQTGSPARITKEVVLKEAAEVGIDVDRATATAESAEAVARMEKMVAAAKGAGFQGTPTFLLGDRVVLGPVSKEWIRSGLEEVRNGAAK